MPSKSKEPVLFNSPLYNPGVVLTAFILAFIQYRMLSIPEVASANALLFPALLFCAVVFLYTADHAWDAHRSEQKQFLNRGRVRVNFILMLLSGISGLFLLIYNFSEVVNWYVLIPASIVLVYLLEFIRGTGFRGIKEVLVSAAVTAALFYPLFGTAMFPELWEELALLFLICLQNMVVFGYFEKSKDDELGNFTLFNGLPEMQSNKLALILLVLISVAVFLLQFYAREMFSMAWLVSLLYLLMFAFKKRLMQNRLYRMVADGLLVLMGGRF